MEIWKTITQWLTDRNKIDKIILKVLALILLFTMVMCNVSCLGSKSIKESNKQTKQIETTLIEVDTSKVETVNKAIDDKVTYKVKESNTGKEDFDKAVNKAVDEILSAINIQKQSGDNSYKLFYDLKAKMIQMEASIGETKNKDTNINNNKVVDKSFEENTDEYIKKKITELPWYIWVTIAWFLRSHIISLIAVFVPGVKGIKSINDLLNPPKKDDN